MCLAICQLNVAPKHEFSCSCQGIDSDLELSRNRIKIDECISPTTRNPEGFLHVSRTRWLASSTHGEDTPVIARQQDVALLDLGQVANTGKVPDPYCRDVCPDRMRHPQCLDHRRNLLPACSPCIAVVSGVGH